MDSSGQGAAFSHDPVKFLLTTSTVAVTWVSTRKNLCTQVSGNTAGFSGMDGGVDHFGKCSGHQGQLQISFLLRK